MRIVFMGTPVFALPSLEKIYKEHEVIAVFTKVDKPNARGKKINYSPIKEFALANNLKIYQPENFKDEALIEEIRNMQPDLIVVVAYGKILPKEIIDIPKYGVINLHSSLLPRFRGAAPINAAIINGDKKSGVSIMYVEEELDAGDVILQEETKITDEDTFLSLHDRLKDMGADDITFYFRKDKFSQIKFPENMGGDIIVNTTPVGMYPNVEYNLVSKEILKKFKVAIDLIYNPIETKFLKEAKECGLKIINGMDMLIEQALKTDEILYGILLSTQLRKKIRKKIKKKVEEYYENNGN